MELRKDHYDKLPSMACETLDMILVGKYSKEIWFNEAWDAYRSYVLKTPSRLLRMPGYIFKKYINSKKEAVIAHHGVLGMKWGVRRFRNKDTPLKKKRPPTEEETKRNRQILKTAGIALGAAAVGAAAVGAAWYIKNAKDKKILLDKKNLAIAKGIATKAARRAAGVYEVFKNVDVQISKGGDFVKAFSNVKIAKILV